ncbi:putative dehydrogenase [Prosthecobacter fusiformis]|uniref:Putative dehydrogenase n=1 Tax=Prosthecobacter fusiformis TaxID=48464 RepID=A0A4R7SSV8_9BACT|nr:Gfo/Idh/MocA family oxidoreductase [Prosthecobacter fusiformis]TDU81317.1 putative dehydrogenase [Prosthecobacter fusiformis]
MNTETIPTTRRDFIGKTAATATVATVASTGLTIAQSANVAGSDRIKVGLIGTGGRGSGAANQALSTKQEGVILHAVADAFKEKADSALSNLRTKHAEKVEVDDSRIFTGLDAYKQVIDTCDLVILTTPPGFRPYHFEAAVNAGKHIFMEKPVAVDAPGVRKVLEMAKIADEKNLKVVVGLQRRYQNCYKEALKQVKEQNIIGDIVSGQVYWNGGGIWFRDKQPNQSELMYQINNWYFFTWLCGDHINEQHIHNIDVANWFIGGHPVSAQGMGGREQRVDKKFGQIFDHHYVEFTYENGVRINSQCRHQSGVYNAVREEFTGTKGKLYLDNKPNCYAVDHKGNVIWKYRPIGGEDPVAEAAKPKKSRRASDPDPYQTEHDILQAAVRDNTPINNAYYGAESTMTAVMGRMATYSGKEITWDECIGSKVQHMPAIVTAETEPPAKPTADGGYPVAIPGIKVEGVEII